jgi:ribonuclease E
MAKKMLIDATHAEETRVVVADGTRVEEFDFESASRRQLAGNIYLAKVTRVEPSLQAAFVEYGGNRHGFLAFSEIHPDYYQIPIADRQALLAEERAYAQSQGEDDDSEGDAPDRRGARNGRRRGREGRETAAAATADPTATREPATAPDGPAEIAGMEMIDLGPADLDGPPGADAIEGLSPMVLVGDTPVETPLSRLQDDGAEDEAGLVEDRGNLDVMDKDDTIETVATEDDSEDVRPLRKPRARRYKIQEVIKVRQIMLVQVVKEERGNKGAALTTYLSLAGRYCVLMPNTARGGGISRKITNTADRKKLKEIAAEIDVPDGAGLIIRTAGSQRTKSEIKRDYEYLQRLWEQIRELTLKSIAPAKIYEEGDLIKRSIRDLYSREIDEVIVEGEAGFRAARDFMKMIMPSHAKNVKLHAEQMPLFARHQVEGYLAGMFNPVVQLPSGGYIVIGVTEALVAIDVNSGRATKEGSIEQTALKTNLEAADEVARQLRLRDLAGLIVVDFIDMDERKNNAAVEKRFKDKLKTDRARIQVGRISGFGLLEMSRQRLRPGMIEATTQPCPHCHGTGLLRSDESVALSILRQLEEEGVRGRSREVLLKVPVGIMNFLMNNKREHIAGIERRYSMAVRIEGDLALVSPDFSLEKFKTATRALPEIVPPVITSANAAIAEDDLAEEEIEEDDDGEAETEAEAGGDGAQRAEGEADDRPRKKRRRRRRRRGGPAEGEGQTAAPASAGDEDTEAGPAEVPADAAEGTGEADQPRRRGRVRSRRRSERDTAAPGAAEAPGETRADATAAAEPAVPDPAATTVAAEPAPAKRGRRSRKAEPAPGEAAVESAAPALPSAEAEAIPATTPAESTPAETAPAETAPLERKPRTRRSKTASATGAAAGEAPPSGTDVTETPVAAPSAAPAPAAAATPEPLAEGEPPAAPRLAPEAPVAPPAAPERDPDRPRRKGWWSLGG